MGAEMQHQGHHPPVSFPDPMDSCVKKDSTGQIHLQESLGQAFQIFNVHRNHGDVVKMQILSQ